MTPHCSAAANRRMKKAAPTIPPGYLSRSLSAITSLAQLLLRPFVLPNLRRRKAFIYTQKCLREKEGAHLEMVGKDWVETEQYSPPKM